MAGQKSRNQIIFEAIDRVSKVTAKIGHSIRNVNTQISKRMIPSFKSLGKNLKTSTGDFEKFGKKLTSVKNLFIAGFVTAFVFGISKMFKKSAELQLINNRFDVVFSGIEDRTEKWAKKFSKDFDLTVTQAKKSASEVGDILKPLGFSTEKAFELSAGIVQLSRDLGSFNAKPFEESLLAVRNALTGEREALKGLGIVVSKFDVTQRLASEGLSALTGNALKQAEAVISLQLIHESATDAIGAHARTADGAVGTMESFKASTGDLTEAISKLSIGFTPLIKAIADSIDYLVNLDDRIKEFIDGGTLKQFADEATTMGLDFINSTDDMGEATEKMRKKLNRAQKTLLALKKKTGSLSEEQMKLLFTLQANGLATEKTTDYLLDYTYAQQQAKQKAKELGDGIKGQVDDLHDSESSIQSVTQSLQKLQKSFSDLNRDKDMDLARRVVDEEQGIKDLKEEEKEAVKQKSKDRLLAIRLEINQREDALERVKRKENLNNEFLQKERERARLSDFEREIYDLNASHQKRTEKLRADIAQAKAFIDKTNAYEKQQDDITTEHKIQNAEKVNRAKRSATGSGGGGGSSFRNNGNFVRSVGGTYTPIPTLFKRVNQYN